MVCRLQLFCRTNWHLLRELNGRINNWVQVQSSFVVGQGPAQLLRLLKSIVIYPRLVHWPDFATHLLRFIGKSVSELRVGAVLLIVQRKIIA